MENNFDNLNEDEKNDLLQKYKNKMMQVLLNIYKRQRNILLKKYLDKWRNVKNSDNESEIDEPKYKKKPRIGDTREYSDSETSSFNPTYANPKQNIYLQRNAPYKKRYAKKLYQRPEQFNYEETPLKRNENNNEKTNDDNDNYNDKDNDNDNDNYNDNEDRDYNGNPDRDYNGNTDRDYNGNPDRDYDGNTDKDYNGNTDRDYDRNNDRNNDINNNRNKDRNKDRDNNKNKERENNVRQIDKDQYSDTSSNNESNLGNGEYLIQNKKVITQPRNYTSQSFFIDKNTANNLASNNYQLNTNNTNQMPMTMKGDFVSLIEQNPKILAQKNPRIQVTNATCDLNQIMNNENTEDELNSEEVNYEMDKLNNNFVIDKNKVLSKVIKNCDKDLYASQKPFKTKKDQWYSVSIPLNDNEAKWEFLNNIKGERDKNNLNKFELIQKEKEPIKEEKEEKESGPYNTKTLRSDRKNINNNKENTYKLREMNYSQFYRSPMKSPKIEEDEKSLIGNRIKRPGERQNTQRSFMKRRGRNFDRSRGKIEFDPKYRSIDYDNGYDLDSDDE